MKSASQETEKSDREHKIWKDFFLSLQFNLFCLQNTTFLLLLTLQLGKNVNTSNKNVRVLKKKSHPIKSHKKRRRKKFLIFLTSIKENLYVNLHYNWNRGNGMLMMSISLHSSLVSSSLIIKIISVKYLDELKRMKITRINNNKNEYFKCK